VNSQVAYFFAVLLIIHLAFAFLLLFAGKIHQQKGLAYLYWSLFLKALLSLGPALLMFDVDISWNAYLTGNLRVSLIPLSYLYLKKLSKENKNLQKNDLWHFLPAAFSIILTLIIVPGHAHEIVGQSSETLKSTMRMIWDNSMRHNILAITSRIFSFGQALVYSLLVFQLFRKYMTVIKKHDSVISYKNALWIKWVVVMFIFQAFFEGFGLLGIYNFSIVLIIGFFYQLVFAFFFVIHALSQKDLAALFEHSQKEDDFTMDSHESKDVIDNFKTQEIYLIPDVTLEDAARQLAIPKHKLTQIIKEAGYDNFYNFINSHRVEKSIKLLSQIPDNMVIESIIKQAGFNSRATFYRVFKQTTGSTPSEYLQKLEKSKTTNS
jgi:AraC-like DNA-binding protein